MFAISLFAFLSYIYYYDDYDVIYIIPAPVMRRHNLHATATKHANDYPPRTAAIYAKRSVLMVNFLYCVYIAYNAIVAPRKTIFVL